MPFAFASPEWSNEKGLGAALGFRLLGINSYHSVYPPVQGSENVMKYLFEDTQKTLGSVMVVEVDPERLADRIISDIKAKRKALSWYKNEFFGGNDDEEEAYKNCYIINTGGCSDKSCRLRRKGNCF
jgi:hypothetical protein